jgi:hypothetical protein
MIRDRTSSAKKYTSKIPMTIKLKVPTVSQLINPKEAYSHTLEYLVTENKIIRDLEIKVIKKDKSKGKNQRVSWAGYSESIEKKMNLNLQATFRTLQLVL